VAQLQAQLKRGLLEYLCDQADDSAVPLGVALKAFHRSRFSEIQSGKFVVSTSGAGKSVSFYIAAQGSQLQPESITVTSQEFREVFRTALVTLTAAGTTYDQNDAQYNQTILSAMLDDDRLQGVTSFSCDLGGLNE